MLSNSYNNDKYGANTTSIFVPIQYKPQIDAVIAWQNTQQDDNGEFIAAIECSFGFGGETNDMLLVTTQWSVFKDTMQKLTDPALLLAFFMDLELPQVDDDAYIKSAVTKQELGNVWYCNDWLLPVPIEVHWAAKEYADDYTILLYIRPTRQNGLFEAYYHNTENNEAYCKWFAVQTKTVTTVEINSEWSSDRGIW